MHVAVYYTCYVSVQLQCYYSESNDKVDTGAPHLTTDSSGSNSSDSVATSSEARKSPLHFVLPVLTPKTPSKGDFTQLKNYTHNQIILNRVLSEEKYQVSSYSSYTLS